MQPCSNFNRSTGLMSPDVDPASHHDSRPLYGRMSHWTKNPGKNVLSGILDLDSKNPRPKLEGVMAKPTLQKLQVEGNVGCRQDDAMLEGVSFVDSPKSRNLPRLGSKRAISKIWTAKSMDCSPQVPWSMQPLCGSRLRYRVLCCGARKRHHTTAFPGVNYSLDPTRPRM